MMKIVKWLACCHVTFCLVLTLTTIGKDCFYWTINKSHTLQLVLFAEEYKSRGATYLVFSVLLLLFLRPIFETVLQGT